MLIVDGTPVPTRDHAIAEHRTTTIADDGCPGTGLVITHRRPRGGELTGWQVEHNREHKQVRARVEHVFARMKTWKIPHDCGLKGDGVHHAMFGIARLHNLLMGAEAGGPLTTPWVLSPSWRPRPPASPPRRRSAGAR